MSVGASANSRLVSTNYYRWAETADIARQPTIAGVPIGAMARISPVSGRRPERVMAIFDLTSASTIGGIVGKRPPGLVLDQALRHCLCVGWGWRPPTTTARLMAPTGRPARQLVAQLALEL